MSTAILGQLAVLGLVVAVGWGVGRKGWLGAGGPAVLSNATFFVFVPALLFRTTARLDLARLEPAMLASYFAPIVALGAAVYALSRPRGGRANGDPAVAPEAASRGLTATYGNSVQLGIPLAAALFGEAGLAIHLSIVSLHALVLLTGFTVLVEHDLGAARARATPGTGRSLARTVAETARATIVHPVILPILAGLAWNVAGLPIPALVDATLLLLAQAVVPLCLVLIGVSLAAYGVRGSLRGAIVLTVLKNIVAPLGVWALGRFVFGLAGLPLAVVTVAAALPIGSNPLLFAQRYGVLQAETTSAIVVSTLVFVATLPFWLAVTGVG